MLKNIKLHVLGGKGSVNINKNTGTASLSVNIPKNIQQTIQSTGGGGSSIEWFELTKVDTTPMSGIKMIYSSGWIEADPSEGELDIYPHANYDNTIYEVEQITPCVMSGGQWHSLDGDGTGSSSIVWGEVITTLEYPDADNPSSHEGVSQYEVALLNDPSLIISPRPLGQEANCPDLINSPPDMRLFAPWFQVTAIVPLVTQVVTVGAVTETLYFFDLQMTRVKEPGEHAQSLFWDDTSHRLIAGFG